MTEKDKQEFLSGVLDGKIQLTHPHDKTVLDGLRGTLQEIANQAQQIQRLKAELTMAERQFQQLVGKKDAFCQLLVHTHEQSQEKGVPPADGLSLNDLATRLGATRAEAVSSDGKLLESTEGKA
jgi:hypothetical protein